MFKKIVALPQLIPHCGIIWIQKSLISHENNSTAGVLITATKSKETRNNI